MMAVLWTALIGMGLITLFMGLILLQHHKRCPKCKRILIEEEEKILICRDCGHIVRQKAKKSWYHRFY